MKKTALTLAALALTASVAAAPAASAAGHRPDTACMQAGIAFLKDQGLFTTVAQGGLPIGLAVDAGVTIRPGADISGVPDPIPLSVVLADHRAGDDSLFVYPWC
ncbi:hypothetical protein [Ornithinimicrobium flavum]|uniref:hypothetical protein n=1 Tax=Ornithinimicrobium flavum TaxID=1288636 RepID=UPI00106F203D|nr:hypothetical protein [Ornithinimicrobium flavum]